MKQLLKGLFYTLIVSSLMIMAQAANEGKKYNFRIAHIVPEGHTDNLVAKKFGEEIEARSNGRMKLRIYPNGQLGNDADMLQQLRTGALDFAIITNAEMTTEDEAFGAWFAPFLFNSFEEALAASKTDVAKRISATVDDSGAKVLGYHFVGFRMVLTADKKIEKPEDLKGLTLRDTPSPVLQDWNRSLGISTEALPLTEVYQAAQTGIIDGMVIDLLSIMLSNFYEVSKYAALTNHVVWPIETMVNEKLYGSLSEEDRTIIDESVATAVEYGTLLRASMEEDLIQQLKDNGIEINEVDKALFADYIKEFDDEYSKKSELFNDFLKEFR